MKKLLILLGLCGTLVACGNSELESMKKELEEVRSENLELKAFLGSENGPNYSMEDIEKISKGEEVAQKDVESDYDKVRDSVYADKAQEDAQYVAPVGDNRYFKQEEDMVLPIMELYPGDPVDGDNPDGHHFYTGYYEGYGDMVYLSLDTDYQIEGIYAYKVFPSKTTLNGSNIILRLKRKQ